MKNIELGLVSRLWNLLTIGPASPDPMPELAIEGGEGGLPSVFHVAPFATACVAAATLAASDLLSARRGDVLRPVHVDRRHAAIAFRSERHLRTVERAMPPVWDVLSGDYATAEGVVRLHTNYAHHREAVLRALGVVCEREAVRRALTDRTAEDVEAAVVAQGGAAAKLRSRAEWLAHPQGRAVALEPLAAVEIGSPGAVPLARADAHPPERPLQGIRVLDVTRVVAGPVCTRVLAAHGADVLRIDPPGFCEVEALLGDTTGGKRRAALDLRTSDGLARFGQLVASADVLVHGLRSDALTRLGLSHDRLLELNPSLVVITHDAYGFSGPWATRRGFDSLVQMSAGLASHAQSLVRTPGPLPLPAQALDHGTGWLLAAAACRALAHARRTARPATVRLSLARTAELIASLGDDADPRARELQPAEVAPYIERVPSAFGAVDRVRCPGAVEGASIGWKEEPGPLGVDAPSW
jgi:hypothetical protein